MKTIKKKPFQILLPMNMYKALKRKSFEEDSKMSKIVIAALDEYFQKETTKKKSNAEVLHSLSQFQFRGEKNLSKNIDAIVYNI